MKGRSPSTSSTGSDSSSSVSSSSVSSSASSTTTSSSSSSSVSTPTTSSSDSDARDREGSALTQEVHAKQGGGKEEQSSVAQEAPALAKAEAAVGDPASRPTKPPVLHRVRKPPLAASSVSSVSSSNVNVARGGGGEAESRGEKQHSESAAPGFVSFSSLTSAGAMDVFDAAFAAVPARMAAKEKAKSGGQRKAKRGREDAAADLAASSPPSASHKSEEQDGRAFNEAKDVKQPARKQMRRDKEIAEQRRGAMSTWTVPSKRMGLTAARQLVATLLSPPAPLSVTTAPHAEGENMTVYLNRVPTELPRAEPLVNPAALFGPHVLLLDSTQVVIQQSALPAVLKDCTVADLQAANEAIRREQLRLRAAQSHIQIRLRRAEKRANPVSDGTDGKRDEEAEAAVMRGLSFGDELLLRVKRAVAEGLIPSEESEKLRELLDGQAALKEEIKILEKAMSFKRSDTPTYVLWYHHWMQQQQQAAARDSDSRGGDEKKAVESQADESRAQKLLQPHHGKKKRSALADAPQVPPSVLLLPSPTTGMVRLVEGHHYFTVKFIGEHLRLTGRLEQWLPPSITLGHSDIQTHVMAQQQQQHLPEIKNGREGEEDHQAESVKAWATMELRGLFNYLTRHPSSSADDYFKLAAEEVAVHTLAEDG